MNDPKCKGQKFGHDFAIAGGECQNGCGITQVELSNPKPKPIAMPRPEPKPMPKGVHTELHDIAFKLWEYYERKEKFGLFLGLIRSRGKQWGYARLSEIADFKRRGQKYPIQFLMSKKT